MREREQGLAVRAEADSHDLLSVSLPGLDSGRVGVQVPAVQHAAARAEYEPAAIRTERQTAGTVLYLVGQLPGERGGEGQGVNGSARGGIGQQDGAGGPCLGLALSKRQPAT